MIAAVAAGTLSVAAFAAEPTTQHEAPGRTGGLMLKKGFIKKGDAIFRVEQVTKATKIEGLELDDQGNILKDGKKLELKEGQMVTPEGEVTKSPLEHGQ